MLFYSDLLKKVKEGKLESLKESYVFRLKITKFLPHIIILLMVLVMSPFLVLIYKEEGLGPFVFLVPLLGLISIAQIVNSFKFKFEIKNKYNCSQKYNKKHNKKRINKISNYRCIKEYHKIILILN